MIEKEKIATPLDGVWLQPLRIIPTDAGPVLHMLKKGYALAPSGCPGEIYFSEVLPGCVKAWKRHQRQAQLFAAPIGQIKIALYDSRHDSPSCGRIFASRLGRPDNYCLLSIPPGIWYGFQAISSAPALICNCADIPHDPDESERLPADTDKIPYIWE